MASIALGVMGALGAAGAIGSSAIQANAAGNAASTQQTAADKIIAQANQAATTATGDVNTATSGAAAGLQAGNTAGNQVISSALQSQLTALQPYIQSGQVSLSDLQNLLGPNGPLSGTANQFSFNPVTSPQLQFEQQQANQALARSSAASGTALSGGTIRASDALNAGLASTYTNQAFNQALATYNTNRQNVLTQIQGLTGLTGLGFNATGAENQDIGAAGQQVNTNIQNTSRQIAANQIAAGTYAGNTGLQAAQIGANAISGAANANSAASLAQGNAYSGLASGLGGTAAQLYGLANAPGPSASSQSGWTGTAAAAPTGAPTYLTGTYE